MTEDGQLKLTHQIQYHEFDLAHLLLRQQKNAEQNSKHQSQQEFQNEKEQKQSNSIIDEQGQHIENQSNNQSQLSIQEDFLNNHKRLLKLKSQLFLNQLSSINNTKTRRKHYRSNSLQVSLRLIFQFYLKRHQSLKQYYFLFISKQTYFCQLLEYICDQLNEKISFSLLKIAFLIWEVYQFQFSGRILSYRQIHQKSNQISRRLSRNKHVQKWLRPINSKNIEWKRCTYTFLTEFTNIVLLVLQKFQVSLDFNFQYHLQPTHKHMLPQSSDEIHGLE